MERLIHLSDLDIDYSSLSDNFKDLTHLAAKVAGTEISLVNLIDSYTQWTIGNHGLDVDQTPREDTVCQYTIMSDDQLEVPDLTADERFNKKDFVNDPMSLRYYFGIPLKDREGINIGALCVMDTKFKTMSPEKIELLKIIAGEIVNRLKSYKAMDDLKSQVNEANESKKKVAHDIRGPLAGIIGLSQIISEQGKSANIDEVMDFINLIHSGSKSILDLADEILSEDKEVVNQHSNTQFHLSSFRDKLKELYGPQAISKQLQLQFNVNQETQYIPFSKNKLLQITGNLISNAIKFTPVGGKVTVGLDLIVKSDKNVLSISVSDNGVGISKDEIASILEGNSHTTKGTSGEKGYGFGLSLVKHLIEKLEGQLEIRSELNQGTTFEVYLPQNNS
ncbi:GAF domain-containing sensor histidine kinase [Pedobacter frigoris]|uniref:GAF domain-containing sensor histidine kinase n=1 Tax=Pedobacter frigoris TaxID=2571272 RepID=UPI00293181A1|nr:GAF domain-containing sensor histidine kinase [Pedobacter frigoris]